MKKVKKKDTYSQLPIQQDWMSLSMSFIYV